MILSKLRDTLPIWVAIPPILLLLFIGWRYRRRSRRTLANETPGVLASVSGASQAVSLQRSAYFAESLASLEESGMPLPKALQLAAGVCGDRALADAACSLSTTIVDGREPSADSAVAGQFPPFMRWALFQSAPAVERTRALRMAAALYRETSAHGIERARIVAPIVALVVLGGSVTLMYGLALFVPVVQMLKEVAAPH